MKFFRGIASFIFFIISIFGVCFLILTKIDEDFRGAGIVFLIISAIIGIITYFSAPKGVRGTHTFYMWVNGLKIFCCFVFIFIPINAALNRMLPKPFFAWKENGCGGLITYYSIYGKGNE